MQPLTLKKRRLVFYLCSFFFVVLAGVFFLYSQGYTLDQNFNILRRGGLYVSAPFSNAEFFVNNKRESTTGISNKTIFIPTLKPGEYSILVAKDGYWPWAKTLKVKEGLVTEARAFGVSENPQGEVIFKGKFLNIWGSPSEDLLMIQEQKNNHSSITFYIPDKKTFLSTDSALSDNILSAKEQISDVLWGNNSVIFKKDKRFVEADFNLSNNSVNAKYIEAPAKKASDFEKYTTKRDQKIWWDTNTNEVFVDWLKSGSPPPYYICDPLEKCDLPVKLFNSRPQIKNIDFFPRRNDVVIMAVGTGIYALEMDGRSGRLIYPVYKGGDPNFTIVQNKIFILDNGSLMKIDLK